MPRATFSVLISSFFFDLCLRHTVTEMMMRPAAISTTTPTLTPTKIYTSLPVVPDSVAAVDFVGV
ncbi:hypothetical protein GBAR_LOCUS14309, partial [Geodia barretti]